MATIKNTRSVDDYVAALSNEKPKVIQTGDVPKVENDAEIDILVADMFNAIMMGQINGVPEQGIAAAANLMAEAEFDVPQEEVQERLERKLELATEGL